jgi:phosphoribosylanthranilate isomerase
MTLWIKICGITNVEDAFVAVAAGADALGVNFVKASKRCVDIETGRAIRDAVGSRVEVVAVVAARSLDELDELRERTHIDWLQLHGNEDASLVESALPNAYKAVGIATAADVAFARRLPGERLLVDAKVEGELGGTGRSFDWTLVRELAVERPVVLAGGLRPENVAEAVRVVRPFGVDVASGVESDDPRSKDPERVRAFVRAARNVENDA